MLHNTTHSISIAKQIVWPPLHILPEVNIDDISFLMELLDVAKDHKLYISVQLEERT